RLRHSDKFYLVAFHHISQMAPDMRVNHPDNGNLHFGGLSKRSKLGCSNPEQKTFEYHFLTWVDCTRLHWVIVFRHRKGAVHMKPGSLICWLGILITPAIFAVDLKQIYALESKGAVQEARKLLKT